VFWWGNLRASACLEDPGIDGKEIIKMGLQEVGFIHSFFIYIP